MIIKSTEPMQLVDTSVWIEFLRGVDGPSMRLIEQEARTTLATCEPVAMEILCGATDDLALHRLERLVNALPTLVVQQEVDYRSAARLFRAVRRSGRTIRSLTDCLIAAVAIRQSVPVVHRDRDFDRIAAVSELQSIRLE